MKLLFVIIPTAIIPLFAQTKNGLEFHSFMHDKTERSYYLHLPWKYNESCLLPLVIVLHGGGPGEGDEVAKHFGFNPIADSENFVVAYPNGIDGQWNDGRGKTFRRFKGNEDVDDVGFISDMIDSLMSNYKIDSNKVYITGVSNGGMMTFRLGCEISSKLAAIAPVIANMPANITKDCHPDSRIPVLIMNGTDDPLVPWNGGPVEVLGKELGNVLSTEYSVRFWVENDECFEDPVSETLPDIDTDDDSRVRVTTYKNSKDNLEVVLYAILNGGHNIPGSNTPNLKFLLGNKNNDINAASVIWGFFKKYSRKS